jgi:hypothetical protein
MEREQFVAVETPTWWLLERDVDYRIEELRTNLGASFGWTYPTWYTERAKLDEVYDFIVAQGSELFYQLEQAADEERRQRWLGSLVALKEPATAPPSAPAPIQSAPTGATPANGAPPRRSAFGSKPQTVSAAGAADAGSGAGALPSTSAPPARKSIFKAKSQLRSPTPEDTARAIPGDEQVGEVDAQIQTVMSELSTEELSVMARDLGLSMEEVEAIVRQPDFARLVAEQQAHLGAEVA